ncbi:hypothetical protein E1265_21735, partial [Streptomyces sp. 8K308]|uniref:condensation domain-containing protein n=1 Tax=Streptomyces sp. 8K308 TaxID=2530388 RepID=UPI00104B69F3
PYDRPRPAEGQLTTRLLSVGWDRDVLSRLEALSVECGTTLLTVVQAAVAALLTRLGAGTDIPLGTPVAGRVDTQLNDLIGHFVNTVVLRVDTSGDPGVRELVTRCRETGLTAYAHQDLPFDRLVRELAPPRRPNLNPLFQTDVTCGRAEAVLPRLGMASVAALPTDLAVAKFDLQFAFESGGPSGGLRCDLSYCAELFESITAERIVAQLDQVIREFAA